MTDPTAPPPGPGLRRPAHPPPGRRDALRHVRRPRLAGGDRDPGRAGFDWLIIDLEHGIADRIGAARPTSTRWARRAPRRSSGRSPAERLRIGRALDLGAHGIMVPRIDTPDQAREAISFMRYPPDGTRGLALSTRGAGLGELGPTPTSGRSTRGSSGSSRSNRRAPSSTPRRSPPSTASTSCSSARPTCRTASASRAGSTTRAISRRSATSRPSPRPPARPPGSCCATQPPSPRHRELGFRFIGLGSDGGFSAAARGPCSGRS